MPYTSPATVVTATTITTAWGNSVKAATDFLANPPACRVYNTASQSIANGSHIMLTFDSERYDTDTMHSTVTNTSRVTMTTAGVYIVTGHAVFAANATGTRQLTLRINGTTFIAITSFPNRGVNTVEMSIAAVYKFAATNYVELGMFQDSGGALNSLAGGNYGPELSATWIGLG